MPLPANIFWTHPVGDSTTIPCHHLGPQHPQGDSVTVPCTHPPVQQHPGGDTVKIGPVTKTVPCVHWVSPHPNGHATTVPCVHIGPQHPGGHPGPEVPCVHPMPPVRHEFSGNLIFYTDSAEVQEVVIRGVTRLRQLGVDLTAPRPLHIFHRDPVNGDPNDNSDPFWSHYNGALHYIQLTRGGLSGRRLEEVVHHELGHALMGHRCVQIATLGGEHSMCQQLFSGTAMSEGWANFVALVLLNSAGTRTPMLGGVNWEDLSGCRGTDPNPNTEYHVGCCLWDLFDRRGTQADDDGTTLSFAQLFSVFSPTLQTLANGPIIPSIHDYVDRLKLMFPSAANRIEAVRLRNVGAPASVRPIPVLPIG